LIEKYDLLCSPDFSSAGAYIKVEISAKPTISSNIHDTSRNTDFVPRLSLLKNADLLKDAENNSSNGLFTVSKHNSIKEAITIMNMYGFSQLPVLSSKTAVDGIISWKSIGQALSLNKRCEKVSDCLDDNVQTLSIDTPLLDAVKIILEQEIILVKRKHSQVVCGILTATDIGHQFLTHSEPFLILEQIEKHLRLILDGKLTIEDIKSVIDLERIGKKFKQIADLSLGHYIILIENEYLFSKLGLHIDRVILVKKLVEVRDIRNSIMHFSPEPILVKHLETLRQTLNFFTVLSNNK
jgi:predicted transcriptional regulator